MAPSFIFKINNITSLKSISALSLHHLLLFCHHSQISLCLLPKRTTVITFRDYQDHLSVFRYLIASAVTIAIIDNIHRFQGLGSVYLWGHYSIYHKSFLITCSFTIHLACVSHSYYVFNSFYYLLLLDT